MMFLSSLIGLLIAEMVKHGDVRVAIEGRMYDCVEIRGFYTVTDEFDTKSLIIEPVDR